MTERSRFWDGEILGDCGPYTQTHLHDQFFRSVLNGTGDRGPVKNWRNELEVTGTSSPVSVNTGGGVVYGMLFDMDAATTVSIPTPSSGTSRYDVVVAQRDWGNQVVRIARHAGTAAVSPAVPTLTQSAGTFWEIPLGTVLVDDAGTITVTDAREFCEFGTTWPADIVTVGMFEQGAITAAKIPDRTRDDTKGSGQLEEDSNNPCTWAAGPSWDYFTFTNGVTNAVWVYFLGSYDIVGASVDFYIWGGPTAVAAGNVKWDYNIYYGTDGGALTNATGSGLVAQGGRAVGTIYRDQLAAAIPVGAGQIVALQITRDGGDGTDTYGSPVWAIAIEASYTADA